MGGNIAKQEIAKFSEDVGDTCNYCKEADFSVNHIRWQCKFSEPQRRGLDHDLAAAPLKHLLQCIQCGIGPAMQVDGEKTFWGADFDEETDEQTKTLLGKDMELHK